MTAAVQADLELEGFPGHITMEDKGLQFGSSFQRHSEPSTPTQYGAVRTVRTQGLFSYREDYRTPVDTSNLPPPDPWLEPAHEPVDSGRISPSRQDGTWFMKLLHAETKRMEDWCKDMEREAEENDLSEESKNPLYLYMHTLTHVFVQVGFFWALICVYQELVLTVVGCDIEIMIRYLSALKKVTIV